jgi:hypothetical protein
MICRQASSSLNSQITAEKFPRQRFPSFRRSALDKPFLSGESFLLIGLIDRHGPFCYFTWRRAVLSAAAGTQKELGMNRSATKTKEPMKLARMQVRLARGIVAIRNVIVIGGKCG